MYYVYILRSKKDNKLYIGYTGELNKRLREHKRGSVYNTKSRLPIELIYFEGYIDKKSAKKREKKLKQFGSSYSGLVKRIDLK